MRHAPHSVAAAIALLIAPVAAQNLVLEWNDAALTAVRAAGSNPPVTSRNLALVHIAMHDALAGIDDKYEPYLVKTTRLRDTSKETAASAAARDVLTARYPTQAATFAALHDAVYARTGGSVAKRDRGVAWGVQVAADLLAARASDGSGNTAPFPGSMLPGQWRPTVSFGGVVRPAMLPLWGQVLPFCVPNIPAVRSPAPPELPTTQYAIEVWITQLFGGTVSPLRTPEMTQIALFWGYGPNTATPPGHWNQIAHAAIANRGPKLVDDARLFALLNIALADACIHSWDCKYVYNLWRPITAINLADTDGNELTVADPSWTPLLETPPFPEYTSGHSTFSGAAAAVLARVLGRDDIAFTVGSDDLPNVTRSYRRFSEAAIESGYSRIFGGIHFLSANLNGLGAGYSIGQLTVDTLLRRR
jgi:hypothetical protein